MYWYFSFALMKIPFDVADIRRLLSFHIPDARKALLLTEIDRVGQVQF